MQRSSPEEKKQGCHRIGIVDFPDIFLTKLRAFPDILKPYTRGRLSRARAPHDCYAALHHPQRAGPGPGPGPGSSLRTGLHTSSRSSTIIMLGGNDERRWSPAGRPTEIQEKKFLDNQSASRF
ncbi:Glucans biosynthesis protein G [Frankliniella fusca]|uniref:Glucans biosynthesis protein G n=1 Tax=Frankliniella fusca TaxID=407009 RepID=A0AAE1H3G8_9NEOP|nr:Glucans biosynthesis protein G [Frankliniella fusca]